MNSHGVCDFCSGKPVVARYHATDFVVEKYRAGSVGDWAACAECEILIDHHEWDMLVSRVTDSFFEMYPALAGLTDKEAFKQELYDLYAQLLQNKFRKGKL